MNVLIADDHEIVRRGLRTLIEEQPGWQVVGEASNGREAVEQARQLRPDVSVLDISMPLLNGLEATRQILKNHPDSRVLILTVHDSDDIIRSVLDAGARGYLLKSDASRDFVTAIQSVRHNKTFFTAKVSQAVLEGYLGKSSSNGDEAPSASRLTPRQREIIQLLAEGQSSKEVAATLNMSVKTAETHRANIMRRLDCHSISALVRYAIRNNLVEA